MLDEPSSQRSNSHVTHACVQNGENTSSVATTPGDPSGHNCKSTSRAGHLSCSTTQLNEPAKIPFAFVTSPQVKHPSTENLILMKLPLLQLMETRARVHNHRMGDISCGFQTTDATCSTNRAAMGHHSKGARGNDGCGLDALHDALGIRPAPPTSKLAACSHYASPSAKVFSERAQLEPGTPCHDESNTLSGEKQAQGSNTNADSSLADAADEGIGAVHQQARIDHNLDP